MKVQVVNEVGKVVWAYGVDAEGNAGGYTYLGYREDGTGTIGEVLMALGTAVRQAATEASSRDYVYRVAYRRACSCDVDRDVPVT